MFLRQRRDNVRRRDKKLERWASFGFLFSHTPSTGRAENQSFLPPRPRGLTVSGFAIYLTDRKLKNLRTVNKSGHRSGCNRLLGTQVAIYNNYLGTKIRTCKIALLDFDPSNVSSFHFSFPSSLFTSKSHRT